MFDRKIKKIEKSKLYGLLLKMVLSKAESFDLRYDYCQLRDDRNDGWDFFYFGFANEKEPSKQCYVQSVNRGFHGEFRIYFTPEDSQKIINAIKENQSENTSTMLRIE